MTLGFDFDAAVTAPFRMQPGLRRLADDATCLHAVGPGDAGFEAKLAVLRDHADEALLCSPGFDAEPLMRHVAAEAARQQPQAFAWDGQWLHAQRLGWSIELATGTLERLLCESRPVGHRHAFAPPAATTSMPAVGPAVGHAAADDDAGQVLGALPADRRAAGFLNLALHEDLAGVDGDRATLPWMAVSLPSHWAPRDKIGRPFAEVHAPVADNTVLLAASAHLMRLVCQPQRWERFVWNVSTSGALDQHPARQVRPDWPARASPDVLAALAWWRTEHQTFLPLPQQRLAVFTIHVATTPLAHAIDSPSRAAALHAAVATMSPSVLAYRGLVAAQQRLLDWLATRASTPA